MSITASPETSAAFIGQESTSPSQAQTSEPPGLTTVEDFMKFWNNPDRPHLTPEEAADFEEDLKTVREEMNAIPLRQWV